MHFNQPPESTSGGSQLVVEISSFIDYSDELGDDYDMGGSVRVICGSCGFRGYVEADSNGWQILGSCEGLDCDEMFAVAAR